MATPPFLKSNRVEDIRDVLNRLYHALGLTKSSVATVANRSSVTETYAISGASTNGKPGERGLKGDPGTPGKPGEDGEDGATLEPIYVRSMDLIPLTTSSGDLISDHRGFLVMSRSLDEVPLFDSQNKSITE